MYRSVFCFVIFSLLLLISCKEEKSIKKASIDKGKISELFNNDVSKLLFDHLYVVLDSISYEKFTKSPEWQSSYAQLDMGLPHFAPLNDTATTCYLRGHQHYIEILGPKNTFNEPVGKSGIGFSMKNEDDEHFHLGVAPKLRGDSQAFLSATETVSMPLADYKETWFKAFYTPSSGTTLHTWYAFYNPTFLDSLHGKEYQTYSREVFLKDTYGEERLFNGVKSISMICTLKDYQRIVKEMSHLGCKILKQKADILTIVSGDIMLSLKPSATIPFSRITQIHCRMNRLDNSVIRLGNLSITNAGFESVWRLHELYKN